MLPLIMMSLFLVGLLWIGRWGHMGQKEHTAADYYVASRSLGPFLLVMSIFGTTMTSFALLGSTGEAWQEGIGVYGLMASWSGIIHSACFFLIGVKLWHFGKLYNYNTQIQFFRDRFQSSSLGLLLFAIIVTLVVPYILINIVAAGNTVERLTTGALPGLFPQTKGAVPQWLGAAVVCAVVFIYVFGGGARSTAWANVMQTLSFMILGLVALFVIAYQLGGPTAASQQVLEHRPDLLARGAVAGHEARFTHLEFLSYMFVPLSVAMFPHLFQNWMTAKSAKAFRVTVMLHPVFIMLVWAPCVLVGIWASSAVFNGQPVVPPGWKEPNAILGLMVGKLTNQFFAGVLAVGVLASTMALDTQFLVLATMFVHDIVLHYFSHRKVDDRQQIFLGRVFVVLICLVAYALSLAAPRSIFAIGVWCFTGFSSMFPLIFAALYWKRVTKAGAFASLLTTAVVWTSFFAASGWGAVREYRVLVHLFGETYEMMPVVPCVVASTLALVVVSLLTKPPAAEVVARFFPSAAKAAAPALQNAEAKV